MMCLECEDGLLCIVVWILEDGGEYVVVFDEEVYFFGFGGGYEFDMDMIWFIYLFMIMLVQIFDYNVINCDRVLRKEQEILLGYIVFDYVICCLMVLVVDGEMVLVLIFYWKDMVLDGFVLVFFYGYGFYGIFILVSFNMNVLLFVDCGFVYVIVYICGGKDKGFCWYKDGCWENKKNIFFDFIVVVDYLVL